MQEFSGQAYNAWGQARLDTWSKLEEVCGRIATLISRGRQAEELIRAVAGIMKDLAPLERFWAFPGGRKATAMSTTCSPRACTNTSRDR
jgi:hypothetical protein